MTNTDKKVRIVLVDDHPLLRHGLRQALEEHGNLLVVGQASTGPEALSLVDELAPDLIIMDVHLPGLNGIEVTRQITRSHPAIKTVIFSADTDRSLVDEALQAGACGYIEKKSIIDQLFQAIEMVLAGRLYLSPELSIGILEDYRHSLLNQAPPAKPQLTDREKQLLRLITAGRRNKEIASELNVSIKSIETYRSRLMKKLDCSSAAELVRYAIREGIATA